MNAYWAVFIIDSEKKSDVFVAPKTSIDVSFLEIVKANLDFKFITTRKLLCDISEYDRTMLFKYELSRLIVVLAKSHTPPGDTGYAIMGYLDGSNEDNTREE